MGLQLAVPKCEDSQQLQAAVHDVIPPLHSSPAEEQKGSDENARSLIREPGHGLSKSEGQ